MERHAAPALRERDHNFRHFRSFLILAHLFMMKGFCGFQRPRPDRGVFLAIANSLNTLN